jgi:hypothetical protein
MSKKHSLENFQKAFGVDSQRPPGYGRLSSFCEQVEAGQAPDPELLNELADACRQLIEAPNLKAGQSAFSAVLDLKSKAGRKPKQTLNDTEPEFTAAVKVFLLDPEGANQAQAVDTVAGETGLDTSTIYRYVRKHKNSAQPFARYILSIERKRAES